MQSSLEFYLSPLVTKLGIPFDIQSPKDDRCEEVSILHLFQLHVQRLFDYGMQLCSDRDVVTESLVSVFVQVRNPDISTSRRPTVRLSLFKCFRKELAEHMIGIRTSGFPPDGPLESDNVSVAESLSTKQREAIFLKVKCEFSYQEVAEIMDIRIKSAHNLVSQALEKMLQQSEHQE